MIWRIIPNWRIKAKRREPLIWADIWNWLRYGQYIAPLTDVQFKQPIDYHWEGRFDVLTQTRKQVLVARVGGTYDHQYLQWIWAEKNEIEVIE